MVNAPHPANIKELYLLGLNRLIEAGIASPKIDARVILEELLYIDSGKLILYYYDSPTEETVNAYLSKITLRCDNMPLSYITNKKEFFSIPFFVKEGVLIPRPETENLVSAVINKASVFIHKPKIADLCAGSGCIGLTLAKEMDCDVFLYDIEDTALEVAEINRKNLDIDAKIIKKDILNEGLEQTFDVIVSNPPYIPAEDMAHLMPEVGGFEPKIALTDHGDGFLFYKRLAFLAKNHLNYGGLLAVETGINQYKKVKSIFSAQFPNSPIEILSDYFGIERVVLLKNIEE